MKEEIADYKALIELNNDLELILNTNHNYFSNSSLCDHCDRNDWYKLINTRFSDFYARFLFLISNDKKFRLAFDSSIQKLFDLDDFYTLDQFISHYDFTEFTNGIIAAGHLIKDTLLKLIQHHKIKEKVIG